MAKIPNNAKKFKIRWNGDVEGGENQNDSIPSNVNLDVWGGGYIPCWRNENGYDSATLCTGDPDDYYFEDFNYDNNDGLFEINILDAVAFNHVGMTDMVNKIIYFVGNPGNDPPRGPNRTTQYTWGDVSFIQEIVDGIGTGSRRARQDRLNNILDDEDKKKKLIHLICRIKGEKVYDDYTEVGSVEVDIDDVELVVERMMGKKLTLEIKSGV